MMWSARSTTREIEQAKIEQEYFAAVEPKSPARPPPSPRRPLGKHGSDDGLASEDTPEHALLAIRKVLDLQPIPPWAAGKAVLSAYQTLCDSADEQLRLR